MVKKVKKKSDIPGTGKFKLSVTLFSTDEKYRETISSSLGPELAAIDSKRVTLQVKPAPGRIEFHLAARDVTALRAAATSLVRLYDVADGVLRFVAEMDRQPDVE